MNVLRKGQYAIEFVVLVTFMFIVFIVMFILIQGHLSSRAQDATSRSADSVMNLVITEVRIASTSSDHYYRKFTLPNNVNGEEYEITIIRAFDNYTELVVTYGDDKEKIYFLESYISNESTIGIGYNVITKDDGKIRITKSS